MPAVWGLGHGEYQVQSSTLLRVAATALLLVVLFATVDISKSLALIDANFVPIFLAGCGLVALALVFNALRWFLIIRAGAGSAFGSAKIPKTRRSSRHGDLASFQQGYRKRGARHPTPGNGGIGRPVASFPVVWRR